MRKILGRFILWLIHGYAPRAKVMVDGRLREVGPIFDALERDSVRVYQDINIIYGELADINKRIERPRDELGRYVRVK